MEELMLRKALILSKKLYVKLAETQDLSKQLAQALDRDDEVTVRMLVSMRSEPITVAAQMRQALLDMQSDLPPQDAKRLKELLDGAEPQTEEETAFSAQVRSNEKLLKQILAMDKTLNLKIARDKSIYHGI